MTGIAAAPSSAGDVLVTGASRGIGRAVALALADAGHDLCLWARSASDLDEVAREARRRGARVRADVVDVSQPEQVRRAVGDLAAAVPALRAVVLNAGGGRWAPLDDTTDEHWRATLATNLDGAFHTLREVVPLLRRHPGAQVIGLASDSALSAMPGRSAYCASKAGFVALLETARAELRGEGIRVTVLAPSRVDTHFGGKSPGDRPASLSPESLAELVRLVLDLPPEVELREVRLSAITSTYGRLPEHAPPPDPTPHGDDPSSDRRNDRVLAHRPA